MNVLSEHVEEHKGHNLRVQIILDTDPDLSYIGQYTNDPGKHDGYIDRKTGTVYAYGEIVDNFGPTWQRNEYRYFVPFAGGEDPDCPDWIEYANQDYDRYEGYNRSDWHMEGIVVTAQCTCCNGFTGPSDSIWGVASDTPNTDKKHFINDCITEVLAQL